MSLKEVFTPMEAMKFLGVGRTKIYELIDDETGEIPFFRIGKLKRIRRKELEAYMEARLVAPSRPSSDQMKSESNNPTSW